jgi:hypothetical protein
MCRLCYELLSGVWHSARACVIAMRTLCAQLCFDHLHAAGSARASHTSEPVGLGTTLRLNVCARLLCLCGRLVVRRDARVCTGLLDLAALGDELGALSVRVCVGCSLVTMRTQDALAGLDDFNF